MVWNRFSDTRQKRAACDFQYSDHSRFFFSHLLLSSQQQASISTGRKEEECFSTLREHCKENNFSDSSRIFPWCSDDLLWPCTDFYCPDVVLFSLCVCSCSCQLSSAHHTHSPVALLPEAVSKTRHRPVYKTIVRKAYSSLQKYCSWCSMSRVIATKKYLTSCSVKCWHYFTVRMKRPSSGCTVYDRHNGKKLFKSQCEVRC